MKVINKYWPQIEFKSFTFSYEIQKCISNWKIENVKEFKFKTPTEKQNNSRSLFLANYKGCQELNSFVVERVG